MKNKITSSTVFQAMEELAPQSLAYEWDNVGLQIGSYEKVVKKVMVTLDVMESTVYEAIENEVDLIIAHHPLLFSRINKIDTDQAQGRIIKKIIQADISVYAAHTNLDIAEGGVNDQLSDQLGINYRKPLVDIKRENLFKIVVFVPDTHVEEVRDALSEGGAGHIGNYSHSMFQTKGVGSFKPLEGTNPFIGTKNKLELVNEVKIETIVNEKKLSTVITKMIKAHPYEEVAYDVFSLKNQGEAYGLGRIGSLSEEVPLSKLCTQVKEVFNLQHIRVTGDLTKTIKKVAILGGSGEKYIKQAKQMGADAYITGDVTFHQAQLASQIGLAVIDIGHYAEKIMKKHTKDFLERQFKNKEVVIIKSTVNTDPFQFI